MKRPNLTIFLRASVIALAFRIPTGRAIFRQLMSTLYLAMQVERLARICADRFDPGLNVLCDELTPIG